MSKFRRLRASLIDFLQQQEVWAIYEPALSNLRTGLSLGGLKSIAEIQARVGMAAGEPPTTQMVGNVAVLPIFGVLQQKSSWWSRAMGWTATETLERDFKEAAANAQIKAIILYCDSPGGTAIGNEEVSRVIMAARGSKPVYAFVRGLCCSAGYYLASAAQQIFASPSSFVGSIGAVSTHIEYSKALAELGLGVTVTRSAPHKQLWNAYEKLSADGKATLQKFVSDYGNQFEQAVARHRGISQTDVRAKFGQGDAFLAAEAKQRGMIDGVLSWETLLGKVQQSNSGQLPATGDDDGNDSTVTRKQISVGSIVQGSGEHADSFAPAIAALSANPELSVLPASSSSAAESAALASNPLPAASGPSATSPEKSIVKISAKVRAALFARGLIQAQDADDAACQAALNAFFVARGEACPQEDDKIVTALFATPAIAATAAPLQAQPATGTAPANNVAAAHEREMAEARQQGAEGELKRQADIRASAVLLGIDAAGVDAAIAGKKPFAEVVAAWHTDLAAKEKPVTNATVKEEGSARYMADAVLATLCHFGYDDAVPKEKITPQIEQLSHAPIWAHAEHFLKAAGVRYDAFDREDIAAKALSMDGYEKQVIRADGGIAYNRPGNFPNLLSALANKILDEGVENADTSYEEYTGVWRGDLPDFKPAPVVAKGRMGELDEIMDAEELKEQGLAEECLSAMQLSRFGNSFALTPVMAANDDLNAFLEDLLGLGEGWELTQNRGCLRLVTSNPTLLDGYQLYDNTNHGNHISSGGNPPSDSEWDAMQIKMANQTTIGAKARQRARLSIALVPTALWRAATQAFAVMRDMAEMKQPATDSNLNVYRGKVTVVHEPDLNDTSSVEWYGFADPRRFANATIIRAYFRGWGRKGKRERWYDPKTKCYYVSLEGRFGAAVKQYRTTIKDKGAA